MSRRRTELAILTLALWSLVAVPAGAYIDGQSATVMFQGVVAALAAGGMVVKLGWRRVRDLLGRSDDGRATARADTTAEDR